MSKVVSLVPMIKEKHRVLADRFTHRRLAAMKLAFYADGIFDLAEGLGKICLPEYAKTLDKISEALTEVSEMLGNVK